MAALPEVGNAHSFQDQAPWWLSEKLIGSAALGADNCWCCCFYVVAALHCSCMQTLPDMRFSLQAMRMTIARHWVVPQRDSISQPGVEMYHPVHL